MTGAAWVRGLASVSLAALLIQPGSAGASCESVTTVVEDAARTGRPRVVVVGEVLVLRASELPYSLELRISKVLAGKLQGRQVRVWSVPVSGRSQLDPAAMKPGTTWAMVLEHGEGHVGSLGDYVLPSCSEGYVRVARRRGEPGITITDLQRQIRIARTKQPESDVP